MPERLADERETVAELPRSELPGEASGSNTATLDALPEDFRDCLVALADAHAEFLIVGGWAAAVHGRPRATEDLDILVRPAPENAARAFAALAAFGAPVAAHGIAPDLFAEEGYGYRFGVKPNLVEILTKISGIGFDDAAATRVELQIDGRRVRVIGRYALLQNKRAPARTKDLDDAQWLEGHPPTAR